MTQQHQERTIAKSLSELKLSNETSASTNEAVVDLDTLLQNDHGRKLFAVFLKDLNNSSDNILTLYLICCCFQNNQRLEDRQRIKQILEKTYNACFIKNQLPQLNCDLKQKLCESLQKTTYNETIFNAVKKELKCMLDSDYYPKFMGSKIWQENRVLVLNAIQASNSIKNNGGGGGGGVNNVVGNTSLSSASTPANVDEILINAADTKPLKTSSGKNAKTNFFAMPSIPLMKNKAALTNVVPPINAGGDTTTTTSTAVTTSRNLKHSKSTSSSSASSIISSSSLSKKSSSRFNGFSRESSKSNKSSNELSVGGSTSGKSKKSKQFPPNPYHVLSTAIPVSVQDSELQSVVSGDIQLDDFDNRHLKKMDNTRIEDVSYNNGTQNLSINSSNLKSNSSRQCKFNKQIKESINANKNANINLPNANVDLKMQHQQNNKECVENQKKSQMPISESDPQKFFEILASKLNKYLDEQNEKPLRVKSFSNSHLPSFDMHGRDHGNENEYEEVYDDDEEYDNYEEVQEEEGEDGGIDVNEMNRLNLAPVQFEKIKENFSLNCRHLLKNVDSDIDVQLEEHIDRVYNNGDHEHSQFLKENRQRTQAPLKQLQHNDSSKMCVKVNSNSDKHKNNKQNNDLGNEFQKHVTLQETSNKFTHKTNNSNNLSLNSYSSKQTTNSNIYKTNNNNSHTPFDTTNNVQNMSSHHNQHHFYKLTSTSKEVDIDSQNYSLHSKTHSHLAKKNHNENLNDSNLSYNIKNLKNTSMNHQHHRTSNHHNDSNSYDRVNDWLSSGFQQQQQESQNSNQFKNEPSNKNCNKELEAKVKQVTDNENVKTTVAYYLPGEDLAYISTYNGKNLTLAQFKQLITKKGNFRYFFKTTSDLLGDECVVYQEANDENSNVPMFNNKVIAKIEKIIN